MPTTHQDIVALEKKFWQSMIDQDTDAALELLAEPSLMVSSHGSMKFDHAAFRKMNEQGDMVIKSYAFSDVEVNFTSDDTAIMTYHVQQTVSSRGKSDPKQQDLQQEMTDSSVWQRGSDGHWRCVMHTETPVEAKKH